MHSIGKVFHITKIHEWVEDVILHQVYVRAFALALAFQMVFWDGEDSNLKNQLHYILASEPWKEII